MSLRLRKRNVDTDEQREEKGGRTNVFLLLIYKKRNMLGYMNRQ